MKSLAIIGSDGMLGSDLVRQLEGIYRIIPINKKNYSYYVGHVFDIVVNANGNSKRYWANDHPLDDFELSTVSVYKSLIDFQTDHYVYISSSDVYEKHESPRSSSENVAIIPEKLTSYGLHKYISESLVKTHARTYLILRMSMMLGSNLKKGPIYDILNDKKLYISKESKLQMITTLEVANILHCFFEKNIRNETFNIGGSGSFSFKNIESYVHKRVDFLEGSKKQIYEMDINKLAGIFPLRHSRQYLAEFLIKKYENL